MLSAHAYSFRQKSRLAISLSWIAGYVNVITLIVSAQMISHNTGNTTWMSRMMVDPLGRDATHSVTIFAYILLCFLFGAILSAFMTEKADRRGVSSRYIAPMAAEAILLSLYCIVINAWGHAHGFPRPGIEMGDDRLSFWWVGLAAIAMGLQNATITKISGSVVRTTHVTGVITDFGLEGVQFFLWWYDRFRISELDRYTRLLRVSRRHPSALRLLLLASIYGSFVFGACAGTVVFYHAPSTAMLAPVVFLIWIVLIDYFKPIGIVTEMDPLGDPELKLYGIVKSLLPVDLGIYRLGYSRKDQRHHAPNFQNWLNRLPSRWTVVILAISPLTQFDSESIADLRSVASRLRSQGRRLIIAGVNPAQFHIMNAMGLTETLEVVDFAPDMEFAIARGIELTEEVRSRQVSADVMI